MLYLSRKIGESIIINNDIEMTIVEVRGRTVKIGFVFPPDASVLRKEIFDNIREQNIAAAKGDTEIQLDDIFGALQSHSHKDTPDGQ